MWPCRGERKSSRITKFKRSAFLGLEDQSALLTAAFIGDVRAARCSCRRASNNLIADTMPTCAESDLCGLSFGAGPPGCYKLVPAKEMANPEGRRYWRPTEAFAAERAATDATFPETWRGRTGMWSLRPGVAVNFLLAAIADGSRPQEVVVAARLEKLAALARGATAAALAAAIEAHFPETRKDLYALGVRADATFLKALPADDRVGLAAMFALEADWRHIDLVPEEGRTRKLAGRALAAAAARRDPTAGELVAKLPPDTIDATVARRAVELTPRAIAAIPRKVVDRELVRRAVDTDPLTIALAPREHLDRSLVQLAVSLNPDAITSAPAELVDDDIAAHAVLQCPRLVASVPRRCRTSSLFARIITIDPSLLRFAPSHVRADLSLMVEATLALAPDRSPSRDLRLGSRQPTPYPNQALVALAANAVRAHPHFYAAVLAKYPRNLGLLPKDRRTPAICIDAVKRDYDSFIFVPDAHRPAVLAAVLSPLASASPLGAASSQS